MYTQTITREQPAGREQLKLITNDKTGEVDKNTKHKRQEVIKIKQEMT